MAQWEPFSRGRNLELRCALATRIANLETLAAVRANISGHAVALHALRGLIAREPGFEARLFDRILPALLGAASGLLHRGAAIDIHTRGVAQRTVVAREDVAGWVAHMVLWTLARPSADHPELDFAPLLAADDTVAVLRCVLAYFDRIADEPATGRFEIERRVVAPRTAAEWAADGSPLTALTVDDTGSIEDAESHLQVDFANRYLGGGVLRGGCVQEEIRFAVAPEHFAAMIVSPRMRDDEAIVMHGAERFAASTGYAHRFAYAGPFRDPVTRAPDGTPDIDFVAIDAIDYRRGATRDQFGEPAMLRELGKARAGWQRDDARNLPVATGNWGCGAFRGDPPLKALLQWIAASAEGRALRYATFGDARVGDLAGFMRAARERIGTAGALWQRVRASVDPDQPQRLYERVLA